MSSEEALGQCYDAATRHDLASRITEALDAATASPTPADSIDRPTLNGLLSEFADTAIKCHIGFKHDGPWEKCEWIECEDRRKLIVSCAPAESTRVAGEPRIPSDFITATGELRDWNVTVSDSARRAAEGVADYVSDGTLGMGNEVTETDRAKFLEITSQAFAAAPADNDAESFVLTVPEIEELIQGHKSASVQLAQAGKDYEHHLQRLKLLRAMLTTTKGDR